jgi:hypothetical protein
VATFSTTKVTILYPHLRKTRKSLNDLSFLMAEMEEKIKNWKVILATWVKKTRGEEQKHFNKMSILSFPTSYLIVGNYIAGKYRNIID